MKPPFVLIVVFVILFTMFAVNHHAVQAADLSAGNTDKIVPHSIIPIPPTQIEPPPQNTDTIPWGVKMMLLYAGLSIGSIILNFLWIQSVKPKRTHH